MAVTAAAHLCVHSPIALLELHATPSCLLCQVPPLRVRPADIIDLERYFMKIISKRNGVKLTLTPEAERQLATYTFPNNINVSTQGGNHWQGTSSVSCQA